MSSVRFWPQSLLSLSFVVSTTCSVIDFRQSVFIINRLMLYSFVLFVGSPSGYAPGDPSSVCTVEDAFEEPPS